MNRMEDTMKRLIAVMGVLVMAGTLMGSSCNSVVRDETVYRTELDFMEQTSTQPADKLVEWIGLHCKCEAKAFVGGNAALCEKSAKLVQVVRSRVPYHKAMMLFNAGVTDKRPAKTPPKVPSTSDLCPGS